MLVNNIPRCKAHCFYVMGYFQVLLTFDFGKKLNLNRRAITFNNNPNVEKNDNRRMSLHTGS